MSILLTRKKWACGQTALELLIMLTLIILFFSVYYTLFSIRSAETIEKRANFFAKGIADRIAFEVNLALTQGENFSKYFEIPETVLGNDYSISIENISSGKLIAVNVNNESFYAFTPAPSIIGDITPGINLLENIGGEIYVNRI